MWGIQAGYDWLQGFDEEGYALWTRDKSKALRFPTKEDAEAATDGIGGYVRYLGPR